MVIDTAKITIRSGKGGDGCTSFLSTMNNPKGGPDGGDGGAGGDIIFQGDSSLFTLLDFRHIQRFVAENGTKGRSRYRKGKSGKNLIIKVPCGTRIIDTSTGEILADITSTNEKVTILKGGSAGRGNKYFAGPANTTPRTFTPGQEGKELNILLDLYLIADVGIIGFPNVGKSSLLSKISNAKPKIADYPFTTLSPHLGVHEIQNTAIVFADIPGLIEGSSKGSGLGNRFLKHIERTRMLLHLADGTKIKQEKSIKENIELINKELYAWNPALSKLEHIYAVNKIDLLSQDEIKNITDELYKAGIPFHKISCKDGTGIETLLTDIYNILMKMQNEGS